MCRIGYVGLEKTRREWEQGRIGVDCGRLKSAQARRGLRTRWVSDGWDGEFLGDGEDTTGSHTFRKRRLDLLKGFIGGIDQQGVQQEKGKKEVHPKKPAFDNNSAGKIDGVG